MNLGLDYQLGDDINALRETVKAFADAEIAPRAAELDRTDQFPMDLWQKMGELGLHGITVPRKLRRRGHGLWRTWSPWKKSAAHQAPVALSYGAHSNLCINKSNATAQTPKNKILAKAHSAVNSLVP